MNDNALKTAHMAALPETHSPRGPFLESPRNFLGQQGHF